MGAHKQRLLNWSRRKSAPAFCLAGMAALAAIFSLWVTRDQTFLSDEWGRFIFYPAGSFELSLHGLSGHLILGHIFLYRALLEEFGAGSYLPFRITTLCLNLGCAWLFFIYARDRADPWLAVAAATLLMFLGSAWEVIATPYGIVVLLPLAFGLGALNCLRRPGIRWELAACTLLVVGVVSQDFLLPFLVGALAMLVVSKGWGAIRSAWVVVVPLLIYAVWFLWSRTDSSYSFIADPVSVGNLAQVPSTLVALPAIGVSAIAGTFRQGLPTAFDTAAGYFLLTLLLLLAIRRWQDSPRPSPRIWVPVSMMLTFGFLVGLALSEGRAPTATRYIYLATLLILLFLLELSAGRSLSRRTRLGATVVFVAGLSANVITYQQVGRAIGEIGIQNRAALSALSIAGAAAPPWLPVNNVTGTTPYGITNALGFTNEQFQATARRFGSPAFSESELASRGILATQTADIALIKAEGVRLIPVLGRLGGSLAACNVTRGDPSSPSVDARRLPPGQSLQIRAADAGAPAVAVGIRRFAEKYEPLGAVSGGKATRLSVPVDNSSVPWTLQFTGGPALVCAVEAQG